MSVSERLWDWSHDRMDARARKVSEWAQGRGLPVECEPGCPGENDSPTPFYRLFMRRYKLDPRDPSIVGCDVFDSDPRFRFWKWLTYSLLNRYGQAW